METASLVFVLLVAVLLSSFVLRMSRLQVPLPLAQIFVGGLLGLAVPSMRVPLDPELFFLLLLPPLLFLDGWRIPKVGLFRDAAVVLELSLGLVVFTVVGMALFMAWLIPEMPLPVAFALAAVLSPTDPLAFSAISARSPLPKRLQHILEGESLLNDASGLVFFKFAVAAALTGTFSVTQGVATFAQLAAGGVAVGVGVAWAIIGVKAWISRRYGEDPAVQILISLLIPFAAYLAAEHLHCSGILASVAAGLSMGYAEMRGQVQALTRIRRNAVWDTLQYTINGFIFVLLGEEFVSILMRARELMVETGGHWAELKLLMYVVVITLGLGVLRFVWVWVSFHGVPFRRKEAGAEKKTVSPALLLAVSLAGVRGAVTLAGAMSLPLLTLSGEAFPARDMAIFIAAGVILCSMLLTTVALPRVLAYVKVIPDYSENLAETRARRTAAGVAIRKVEEAQHNMAEGRADAELYTQAALQVMEYYRLRTRNSASVADDTQSQRKVETVRKELMLVAIKAEREEIYRLLHQRKLGEESARKLIREIDLSEARFL